MSLREDLLHYIWKYKRFDHRNLKTIEGLDLNIENYGIHNHGSGPDFHNSRLSLGETMWAGNVEIHIKSSDWNKHKHQNDPAYDNVILHVVYDHDKVVYNTKSQKLPTLELKSRIDSKLIEQYQKIHNNTSWIPCESQISKLDSLTIHQAIDRALIQRLERKSMGIINSLKYYNNDWDKVCYQSIATSLGAKINKAAFEHLARISPLEIIAKHGNNLLQIEAILLGQAGLLSEKFKDEYPVKLKKEYEFLKHKYDLEGMKREAWQFSGLRPASFPHVRVAQLARILWRQPRMFAQIKSLEELDDIDKQFQVFLEGYWETHYNFNKESKFKKKVIGAAVRYNLLINSVVPLLFTYGDLMNDEQLKQKAIDILGSMKPESNKIIKKWNELGVKSNCAGDSQGLLELKNECCTFKKCLACSIGVALLKS